MRKSTIFIIILILLAIAGAGFYYWLYFMRGIEPVVIIDSSDPSVFTPINTNVTPRPITQPATPSTIDNTPTTTNSINDVFQMPKLRQISSTPVAGMSASTTKIMTGGLASTTKEAVIVRFVDRGTGHVSQANNLSFDIEKISNTTLPKIYETYWNKNLTFFILRYLKENTDTIINFYAEIRPVPSAVASSTTPFEIKGRYLAESVNQIAVSPQGDRVFTWNIEGGRGVGYISTFDEKNKTKIFETPITQMNIDWPEASTVTATTKSSSVINGYAYTINTKTTESKKLLGGIRGLSIKMSSDGKNVLYSSGGNSFSTNLLKGNETSEVIFNTIVDKCVWSKLRKNEVYCAVPVQVPSGSYPDDWYKGVVSFIDQIWILDTDTGEVHLLANLLDLSKSLIDAIDLKLDPSENYLYFINKRDLSLWSLDLNQ